MSSLRHLAQRLSLSITTVSRALDGYTDVAPQTRDRVLALAGELNYRPNAAARSLRKNKADAVAVALPQGTSQVGLAGLINMVISAGPTFAAAGLDLLMLPIHETQNELDVLRRLIDGRRADAIILLRTWRDDPRVAYLIEKNVPFITHGRTQSPIPHAFIDGDGAQGFRDATAMLAKLGHRRIAHIAAPQDLMFAYTRRSGWLEEMQARSLAAQATQAIAPPTESGGRTAALQLLAGADQPTALLCATDAMAIGALSAVHELGMLPGRDVSIVGHDALPSGEFTDPPLSTMSIAAPDVGTRLARLLLRRVAGTPAEELQEFLPITLNLRRSHGPPPAKAQPGTFEVRRRHAPNTKRAPKMKREKS